MIQLLKGNPFVYEILSVVATEVSVFAVVGVVDSVLNAPVVVLENNVFVVVIALLIFVVVGIVDSTVEA